MITVYLCPNPCKCYHFDIPEDKLYREHKQLNTQYEYWDLNPDTVKRIRSAMDRPPLTERETTRLNESLRRHHGGALPHA